MFKLRIIAVLIVFTLSFGQVSALEDLNNSRYDEALRYLDLINVIDNKEKFDSDELINKAEFITLLLKHAGYDEKEMKRKLFPTPFQDVPLQSWYSPYVYAAYEDGLIQENDLFYPNKHLTRYEALSFFFLLEGISAPFYAENVQEFKDLPSKSKVNAIVLRALDLDLIIPVERDHFGVMQKMKKGEVALMLYNYALSDQSDKIIHLDETVLGEEPDLAIFLDVWTRIHEDFVFAEDIDDEAMIQAAIEAMVRSLEDPFSVYMPPEEGGEYSDSLEGELEGIGAYIGLDDKKIIIVSPIQGSPAQEAGLLPNDEIIKIDDEDVVGLPLFEVVRKIKGPKETKVKITILRNNLEKNYTITRAKIDLKSVALEMQNNIAVISLNQFISRTSDEFDVVVKQVLENNAKGIILDLRNNPGGFLGSAVDVLGNFIEKGEVVVSVDYPTISFEQKSKGEAALADLPLIVLVNEGSASAAEIMAGALQDLELAIIMGQQTYGKGTVQELTYYTDDSNLKLTVAKWLTPKGRFIDEKGLTPDIEVENKEGRLKDYQMERALEEIQKLK